MYFILPLGHEENEVRRIPWVTAAIFVLCVLVHLFVMQPSLEKEAPMFAALDEAFVFYLEHPYLEPSPEMKAELRTFGVELESGRVFGQLGQSCPAPVQEEEVEEPEEEPSYAAPELLEPDFDSGSYYPPVVAAEPEPDLRAEQAKLDRLFREYLELKEKNGERLGLIPGDFEVFDLIAAIFLHGGWAHLLNNLFLFWLCAPILEDAWGRSFFAAFFLVAGCVSGLFWLFLNLGGMIPMVGASGAIAGLMGAFAVRFKSSRITFFWILLWFRGTFSLPAWLTLGFWFAGELFWMTVEAGKGGGGVAFAAHVGGFAFGALAVSVMSRLRVEERFLAPAIEKKLVQQLGGRTNVELAKALGLIDLGRDEEAWGTLLQALDKSPNDPDCAAALWDLAIKLDRREQAVAPLVRQLNLELRGGDRLLALQRWDEIRDLVLPAKLDVDLAWRLVEAQVAEGSRVEARDLLDLLPLSAVVGQQLTVKIRVLKLAMEVGSRLTLPLAEYCAALPDIPGVMKVTISAGLSRGREIEAEQRYRREQLGSIEVIPFADQVRLPVLSQGPLQALPDLPAGIFEPVPTATLPPSQPASQVISYLTPAPQVFSYLAPAPQPSIITAPPTPVASPITKKPSGAPEQGLLARSTPRLKG